MSQLTTFARQVETTKVAVEKLLSAAVEEGNPASLAAHYASLQKVMKQIQDELEPTCEKLKQKLGQIDPVTGAKRYGALAEQKFLASADSLLAVKEALGVHVQQHEDRYISAKSVVEEEKKKAEMAKAAAMPEPVMSRIIVEKFSDTPDSTDVMSSATAESEELHQKAEELRLKKFRELDDFRAFEMQLDQTLRNTYANNLNDYFLYADTNETIKAMKQSSKFSSTDWKAMKSIALDILGRIISKPDDVNLRKLRATHPAIQSKITSKMGGIPFLLSLGFQMVVKRDTPSAKADENTDDLSHHPQRLQWLRQHRQEWEASFLALPQSTEAPTSCWLFTPTHTTETLSSRVEEDYSVILPLCSNPPVSPWELWFEMEEPPIDDLLASTASSTSDHLGNDDTQPPSKRPRVKLTWIDWYDRLQASIALLEQS